MLDYMVAQVKRGGMGILEMMAEVNKIPLKMLLATMAPSALPNLKNLADLKVASARTARAPAPAPLELADDEGQAKHTAEVQTAAGTRTAGTATHSGVEEEASSPEEGHMRSGVGEGEGERGSVVQQQQGETGQEEAHGEEEGPAER